MKGKEYGSDVIRRSGIEAQALSTARKTSTEHSTKPISRREYRVLIKSVKKKEFRSQFLHHSPPEHPSCCNIKQRCNRNTEERLNHDEDDAPKRHSRLRHSHSVGSLLRTRLHK